MSFTLSFAFDLLGFRRAQLFSTLLLAPASRSLGYSAAGSPSAPLMSPPCPALLVFLKPAGFARQRPGLARTFGMFLLYFPLEDRNFPLKIPNEKLGRGTFTLICYKNLQSWEVSARSKLKGENLL